MSPIEQRSQPPRDTLPVAPTHSPQTESCYESTERDTEWPELVSFAEQARRIVRAKVVRVVADRTKAAIWSLCESGRGASLVGRHHICACGLCVVCAIHSTPLGPACKDPRRHPRRRCSQSSRQNRGSGASRQTRWRCDSSLWLGAGWPASCLHRRTSSQLGTGGTRQTRQQGGRYSSPRCTRNPLPRWRRFRWSPRSLGTSCTPLAWTGPPAG